MFVEKELFPYWGVKIPLSFTGSRQFSDRSCGKGCAIILVGDLNLFHHRPYECLLGYINVNTDAKGESNFKLLKGRKVIMSVPGAHSRKSPLQKLLSEYIPGPKPPRCIELFARELFSGWTSWGNEPLHFQNSIYFSEK